MSALFIPELLSLLTYIETVRQLQKFQALKSPTPHHTTQSPLQKCLQIRGLGWRQIKETAVSAALHHMMRFLTSLSSVRPGLRLTNNWSLLVKRGSQWDNIMRTLSRIINHHYILTRHWVGVRA